MSHPEPSQSDSSEKKENRFELWSGLTLAVFAAVLALNDLAAGKFGEDELKGTNEKASALSWYQSKSIKRSLLEGQKDMVNTLIDGGAVKPEAAEAMKKMNEKLDKDIVRYKKEMKEIMFGSKTVGEKEWAQDVDGKMGQVKGAKEWEAEVAKLSDAGDRFDLATLFLQMSLVLGAVSLVLSVPRLKWVFYFSMVISGVAGLLCSLGAFRLLP
jgi:hypothetical protein